MKTTVLLFVLAVMLSCSTENVYDVKQEDATVSNSAPITMTAARATSRALFGGAIGDVDPVSGEISYLRDRESILKVFNSILEKDNIDAHLTRLEFKRIKGLYYLRGYGSDYKSTMLLMKDESGDLQSSGVTCTTKDCSHTSGCEVTMSGHCSACTGDCTKSTTVSY